VTNTSRQAQQADGTCRAPAAGVSGATVCDVRRDPTEPSTADGKHDDQTVRRIVDFSHQWGHDSLVVVNLFGLRATQPAALALAEDPIGPDNDQALLDACLAADLVIAAWGCQPRALNRAREVLALLDKRSTTGRPFPMSCLGRTAKGKPRHPSRRSRSASLEVFR